MNRLVLVAAALGVLLNAACGRSAPYYLNRGNKFASDSRYDEAVLNYRKVIQSDARNGEAYYQLGLALVRLRRTQEAYEALSRAAELLPSRDDIGIKLADLMLSAWLTDSRHPKALHDKLAALSDQLLARNADSWDGLRLKGHLAAADKQYTEAEEFYRRANQLKPLQPEVVLGWTEVLFQEDKPQKAETLAFQLIGKDKSYGPIYDVLYRYYAHANRRADAEKILQTRLGNNPADAGSALQLAAFYAAASREGDMQSVLQRMLFNPLAFPQARLQVGDFYGKMRRWNDALHQYEEGSRANPKEKVAYQKKIADVWLAQGNAVKAENVVDEILKEAPDDQATQEVKASLLLATRKPENITKAVLVLQTLAEKNPDDANIHFNLGRGLAAKGDQDGARIQFLEATRKRPGLLPPRIALLELSEARGDYKTTLQYADQILALHPDLTQIRLARAVSLMNTGRHAEAAAELAGIEKALPKNREVQLQTATLNLADRKLGDAENRFRKLVHDDGEDARALSGLVQTLAVEKQIDKALAILQEQLKKSPDSVAARSILAKTAAEAGKYDLSIEQYQRMLAAAPKSAQTCLALGTVYRLKGDLPNAISYLQRAHSLAPNDPGPIVLLAGALALSGRKSEALDDYRRALKLKPDDAAALNNAAYLLAETGGSLEEALNLAQKAVRVDSGQPNYADTLGWVYLKKHLNDSAAQVFRGLIDKYPDNPTFHYHFGMALSQKGDKAAAHAEFTTALSKRPSETIRRNIESALAGIS